MAVTPNYNWPIPVATDYVKDGYDAIADLGNAIDTTVAGLGSGLKFITGTTFTGQSSVSINNCFSSTYENYRIFYNFSNPSSDGYTRFRLRASGTDNTSSNYYGMKIRITAGGASSAYGDNASSFVVITGLDAGNTGASYSGVADIANPYTNTLTTWNMNNTGHDTDGTIIGIIGGNFLNVTGVFDGFTIYTSAGTINGTIRVYGYQNS